MDTTSEMENDTAALRHNSAKQHKADLMEWICPFDYHVKYRDFIGRRHPDTGNWFLQDPRFQGWDQSKDATLLCRGHPGAGKTIMATLVIDHLLRTRHKACHPIVFIYCDYKRQSEQSAKHMLSSVLRQIVDVHPGTPEPVQDFYKFHTEKRTTPSTGEISESLETASKDLHGLTVVIDALDECEIHTRQELLLTVGTLRKQCEVRLLATSRFLPAVESHSIFLGKPRLEVRASDEDLKKYIRSRAIELPPAMSKPGLFEDIVSSTVSATGGMYVRSLPR
jgi:Cdc6-like AAA superfamily ATPase